MCSRSHRITQINPSPYVISQQVCVTLRRTIADTNTNVQTVARSSRTTSEGDVTRKTNQGLRELKLLAPPPIQERRGKDGVAHSLPMI